MMLVSPTIKENFFPKIDCDELINIYKFHAPTVNHFDCEHRPLVAPDHLEIFDFQYLQCIVLEIYKQVPQDHFIESIAISQLSQGDHIPSHSDPKGQRLLDGKWGPSDTPFRSYATILYLNEDFEGGKIFFDQQNVSIQPKTGMLIAFPAKDEFTHGVEKIIKGDRYALLVWYTQQKNKAFHHKLLLGSFPQ